MAIRKVKDGIGSAAGVAAEAAKTYGGKAAEKAKIYGRQAAEAAKGGAQLVADKAQESGYELRRKYYSPIFPDQLFTPGYDIPRLVVIADEDERKGVDVCEGAVGWLGKTCGLEVLHLYGEAVADSGFDFYPMPSYGGAYYREDLNGDKRFISLDCYLDTIRAEKMTELKQIACKLGAKECRLESYEEAKRIVVGNANAKKRLAIKEKGCKAQAGGEASIDASAEKQATRRVLFEQEFEGNSEPQLPKLYWYAGNKEIASLIESRFAKDGGNRTKSYRFEVGCSVSSALSADMAGKVDAALDKLGAVMNFSLKGEVQNDLRTKMIYEVRF